MRVGLWGLAAVFLALLGGLMFIARRNTKKGDAAGDDSDKDQT